MEVSTKNTKAELLKYIEEQQVKIAEMKAQQSDSQAIAHTKQIQAVEKEADVATSDGMMVDIENLVDDFKVLVESYKNLQNAISVKVGELEALHGIERELLNMEAIMNAKVELEANVKEETTTLKRQKDAEMKRIIEDHNDKVAELNKGFKEAQKDTDTLRKRLEEEYQYNIQKAHREQKDVLEAELKQQRKETDDYCAEMNGKIKKQLDELEEMATNLAVRESNMEELEKNAKTAEEQGYAKGKAEAGKEWAFEKRAIEAKHEKEEALLKADLKAAEKTIKDLEGRVKELNEQLAEVRKNHQALAEKSIEAGAKSTPVFMPMGNYTEQNQGRGK